MLDLLFFGMLKLAGIVLLGYVIILLIFMTSVLVNAEMDYQEQNNGKKKSKRKELNE